ncbi:Tetracycline resistance protein, class B [Marinomonas spartinae]|uniref:MFS transporter n=1 Tax=Marinomonas spartinae TaxID=1792290 RepID=UPI000808CE6E|nr:MFS transporter [Marinomonas spartinae]SBS28951.1 Tetracycline resistance protein, class B [Marinomonas spartinae]
MSNMTSSQHAPAGRREGLVIALGSSLTIVGSVMIAPIIPKLGAHFGPVEPHADVLIPLAISIPALAIAVFAPLAGWLADKVGRKNLLIIATVLYAFLGMAPALLNDLSNIVLSRLLFGLAEATIMTCCTTLIADYWRDDERLRFVNYQVIAIGVVGAVFFPIGGAMGEHSWRTPFFLYLLPLVLVPLMMKVLWEPAKKARDAEKVAVSSDDEEGMNVVSLVISYLMIFFGMVLVFVETIQAPILQVHIGITSTTQIGSTAGVALLATLVGSLIWTLCRKILGINGCNVLLFGTLGLGLWILSVSKTYEMMLLGVIIHGVGAGLLVPNVMASVMKSLSKHARGRGIGGFTSSLYLGQFVSPLIVSFILAVTGVSINIGVAYMGYFGLALAVFWLAVWVFSREKPAILTNSKTAA